MFLFSKFIKKIVNSQKEIGTIVQIWDGETLSRVTKLQKQSKPKQSNTNQNHNKIKWNEIKWNNIKQ